MIQHKPGDAVVQKALARWKGAADKGMGKLGISNFQASSANPVGQALAAVGAEVITTPLLDEHGRVAEAHRNVDVLVSGGQQLYGEIYDQLNCRMILRPYVGYNDIN